MSYYTGDVLGEFLWEYEEDGKLFQHVQDPFFLTKYGGEVKEEYHWEGCHCFVEENNLPYCMQCYDSAEQHRAVANKNDLKSVVSSYRMRIFRQDFDERVRPWIQEIEPNAKEFITHLTFEILHNSVHYNEWACTHTLNNFEIVQDYCFLKQIEYYFDNFEEEQCCVFHIYN